jgi:hypothetical protein
MRALSLVGQRARSRWVTAVTECPDLASLITELPEERMSSVAKRFAEALYAENRRWLSQLLRTMVP